MKIQRTNAETGEDGTYIWVYPESYTSPPQVFCSCVGKDVFSYTFLEISHRRAVVKVTRMRSLPDTLSRVLSFKPFEIPPSPCFINLLAIG